MHSVGFGWLHHDTDLYMRQQQRSFVHSGRSARVAHGRNSGFHLECSMLGLYVVCQDEMPYCSLSTWNTGSDKHDIAPLA